MNLPDRIERLRALADRPGTPAEGAAARRVLDELLRRRGDAGGVEHVGGGEHETEIRLPRPIGPYQTALLLSAVFSRDRTVYELKPASLDDRHRFVVLGVWALGLTGAARGRSREILPVRPIGLSALGCDSVREGERVAVRIMSISPEKWPLVRMILCTSALLGK